MLLNKIDTLSSRIYTDIHDYLKLILFLNDAKFT